ncbi:MAG: adenosylcobinamide-phosphate synthase CbiB [Isosphaeraceae bacterium]
MMLDASRLGPLLVALSIDLAFGDPPNRYHPVAWMGRAIAAIDRRVPRDRRWLALACGAALALGGGAVLAGIGWMVGRGIAGWPPVFGLIAEGLLLKVTFSIRGLVRAARDVQAALDAHDLPAARRLVAWHLVSRDTSDLDAHRLAAATVESVAENASDAIVAPLLFYALAGLPGALAYRWINTADAMLGYRNERYEWFGKAAARCDDLLNWLPSRLTALLMLAAAPAINGDPRRAWSTWRRDARRTSSPNAGHPMSMAAGALGVELEKVGYYRLGRGLAVPTARDIGRSIRLLYATIGLTILVAGGFLFLVGHS